MAAPFYKGEGENNVEFKKLNPTDEVELGIYEKAMEFIFSDDDIQNVAISGAYGAGKSSILESYKKKLEKEGDNKKFLHISLAHFENKEKDNTKYAKLEGKILNQLLHQIRAEKIPLTNFKIKKSADSSEINKMTTGIISLLIIFLYFLFYKQWEIMVGEFRDISLKFTLTPWFKTIMIMAALGIVTYFVRYTIRIQVDKRVFKKLSFQGTEIELFNEENDSYFDKYLNEVIYLFENSGADVIVFEDMDRFNDVMIFERLREINQLINIGRREAGDTPLRFFYVLRDDIFTTKDRTKFFDYILPVVPIIDGSNSYSELKTILHEEIDKKIIDTKFLQDISLYIDDMRILKNICNEFFVYNAHINETELGGNKLFAMITYKNVFPKDFSDLQLGKGYIYTVLDNKKHIVEAKIATLEKKVEQINGDLQKADREVLTDRQEVGAAIALRYYSGYNWSVNTDIVRWIENRGDSRAIDELHERIRMVELKQEDRKEELLAEKRKLLAEKQSISEKPLHELITKENEDTVFMVTYTDANGKRFCYEEVKGNDYFALLKNLIWNGYIDESYPDYMTYFYEGEMKKADKVFLRSVADHRPKKYEYPLQNPGVIVEHLRDCDFRQEETLNYDLAEYLIRGEKKGLEKQRNGLIEQIKENRNFDFLMGLLDEKRDIDGPTARCVCEVWSDNFKELLHTTNISGDYIWKWATALVCYVSGASLEQVNTEQVLSTYLSQEEKALQMGEDCYTAFVENAAMIGVKVVDLQLYEKDDPVFALIIESRLYQIFMPNIIYVLKSVYGENNESELIEKNYTVLRRHEDGDLFEYLAENMERYIYCYIETAREIRDDSDAVLEILNDRTLSEETKCNYIWKLATSLEKLEDIQCEAVWDKLMEKGLLLQSEDNLLYYYERKGLTNQLVTYVNAFRHAVDFRGKFQEKNEVKSSLFDKVIKSSTLKLDKYEQLSSTLGYYYTSFSIQDIECDRMEILIKNRIVRMNEATLQFMRENYKENMATYLAADMEGYLDIMEETEIPEEELKILFEQYDAFSLKVQEQVVEIGRNHLDELTQEKKAVSKSLVFELLEKPGLKQSEKDDLLTIVIAIGTKEEVKQCLNEYGRGEFCRIFDFKLRPRYEINAENRKILQALKERGYISEFPEDKEQNYYRIRRT